MLERMLRTFVPNYTQTGDPAVTGAVWRIGRGGGYPLNLLLFAGKLLAGIVTGAISVTADAFNNHVRRGLVGGYLGRASAWLGRRPGRPPSLWPRTDGIFGWTAGFPDDFIGGSGAGEKLYWQDPSPGGDGADRPHRGHPGLRCGGEAVDGVV